MKIAGIKARVPSRKVTNQDIERMVTEHSSELNREERSTALNRINFFLTFSGSRERRWLADGEQPFELLASAVEEALN